MSASAQALAGGRSCPSCRGRGVLPSSQGVQVCPNCSGNGVIQQQPIRVPFDVILAPAAALTALQLNVPATVTLDQDADFEWVHTVATSTGIFSVAMFDPSTGRQLQTSGGFVNSENFAGTAQLPWSYVEPYVWARGTVIKAVFNDRSNAGNTIQLVLKGFKLYPRNNPAQGSQGALVAA